MISDVAALYVDPLGPYPKLVEQWYDAERDARNYYGPWPVVAHPPCGPWSKLRHLYEGDEADLMNHAMAVVRECGGVLEQPAGSRAFKAYGCPLPGDPALDRWGGCSWEVQQSDWGHPARKRTWLYCVRTLRPRNLPEHRDPTHWCSGGGTGRGKTPPGIKVCSAQQRRRTPEAFARWLIWLARQALRDWDCSTATIAKGEKT